MINMFLALLVDKLILTQKEAEVLSKELNNSVLPSDFKNAQRVLNKMLQKIQK